MKPMILRQFEDQSVWKLSDFSLDLCGNEYAFFFSNDWELISCSWIEKLYLFCLFRRNYYRLNYFIIYSLLIILTLFLFLCLQIFITLFEDYENYDEEKINKDFKSRKFLLKKKKRKIGYFNVKDYLSKCLYYIKIFF